MYVDIPRDVAAHVVAALPMAEAGAFASLMHAFEKDAHGELMSTAADLHARGALAPDSRLTAPVFALTGTSLCRMGRPDVAVDHLIRALAHGTADDDTVDALALMTLAAATSLLRADDTAQTLLECATVGTSAPVTQVLLAYREIVVRGQRLAALGRESHWRADTGGDDLTALFAGADSRDSCLWRAAWWLRARAAVAVGEFDVALDACEHAGRAHGAPSSWLDAAARLAMAELLHAVGDLSGAADVLDALEIEARRIGAGGLRLDIARLHAQVCDELDDKACALAHYRRFIVLDMPAGRANATMLAWRLAGRLRAASGRAWPQLTQGLIPPFSSPRFRFTMEEDLS